MFARKARCAYCGYVMRSSKTKGRHYLQCPNHHVAADACPGAFIAVDKLEQAVLAELKRLSQTYLDWDAIEQNIEFCANLQEQKTRLLADLDIYRDKVAAYAKELRELYLDKVKGVLTEGDYVALSADFTKERNRMERVIADGERQLDELEERIAAGDNRRALVEQYTNADHLTREMVDILIDHVSVGRRVKGTKTAPVEIFWNF